jgi:hypothetical protein
MIGMRVTMKLREEQVPEILFIMEFKNFYYLFSIRSTILWNSSPSHLLSCWYFLGLFFNPEDGGEVLLRNVG